MTRRWGLWTIAKLLMLALVVVIGASALVRDSRPAHASHTAFHLSYSSTCLTIDQQIFAFVGGPPQNIYLCAKNIDNTPWGAGGFNLELKYVSWLVNVNSVDIASAGYAGGWLGSTGRAAQCLAVAIEPNIETGQGHIYGGCHTVGNSPPYGPVSNTVIGKLVITPGIVKASTSFDFRGTVGYPTTATHLVSAYWEPGTPEVPFTSILIPAYAPLVPVYVAPCADYVPSPNGDNVVSIQDVLNLAQKYGRTVNSPPPPTWNPDWDMNGDNSIGVQDILIGAKQWGRTCPP